MFASLGVTNSWASFERPAARLRHCHRVRSKPYELNQSLRETFPSQASDEKSKLQRGIDANPRAAKPANQNKRAVKHYIRSGFVANPNSCKKNQLRSRLKQILQSPHFSCFTFPNQTARISCRLIWKFEIGVVFGFALHDLPAYLVARGGADGDTTQQGGINFTPA
jgi:hypothetical protein